MDLRAYFEEQQHEACLVSATTPHMLWSCCSGPLPESWLCSGLPALSRLHIHDNKITSLPSCCPLPTSKLLELGMSGNDLGGALPFAERQCTNGTQLSLRSM